MGQSISYSCTTTFPSHTKCLIMMPPELSFCLSSYHRSQSLLHLLPLPHLPTILPPQNPLTNRTTIPKPPITPHKCSSRIFIISIAAFKRFQCIEITDIESAFLRRSTSVGCCGYQGWWCYAGDENGESGGGEWDVHFCGLVLIFGEGVKAIYTTPLE